MELLCPAKVPVQKSAGLIEVKVVAWRRGHRCVMPFYRFHVCDPVNRIDGHDHGGAALADDIDAMLYAAGIVQRLVREQPRVPRNWAIEVSRDSRRTGVLSFEAGLKVMLRPHWVCDQPREAHEGWG